jgi:hypothetical protein
MKNKVKVKKEGKSTFRKFKNWLSFIIILVFSAFVFYIGWIQIKIPEGNYALVYTKTGGYDSRLIAPGQFVWRWENLFPENMTIHFIELKTSSGDYHMEGFLPSGELYGEYIRTPDAFHYILDLEYRFSINQDEFVSLIESESYSTQLLEERNQQYRRDTNHIIQDFMLHQTALNPQGIKEVENDLRMRISEADSRFNLEDLRIRSYQYPDTELYERTRSFYLDDLAVLRKIELQAEQDSTQIETVSMR